MSEWIKCSEQMPPMFQIVLLFRTWPKNTAFNLMLPPLHGRTDIIVGGRTWPGKFISYEDQHSKEGLEFITHWMPLPEEPKNDQ